MSCVLDVGTTRVFCRFGHRLADWGLHLIGIRLRQNPVEIQVHNRLVDTVKILQLGECNQSIVAEALGLISGELSRRADGSESNDQGRGQNPGEAAQWLCFSHSRRKH